MITVDATDKTTAAVIQKMRCRDSTTHFLSLFGSVKAFVELFDSTAGINELLLAGKERMALGADIDGNNVGLLGSARFKGIAARTDNCRFSVLGMDGFFHVRTPLMNVFMYCYYTYRKGASQRFSRDIS